MRNVKKFLALVLAMLMVVSAAATVSAFDDVAADHQYVEAINDLSEDVRREIDTIYQAIAALSIKDQPENTPRPKIGFKTSSSK